MPFEVRRPGSAPKLLLIMRVGRRSRYPASAFSTQVPQEESLYNFRTRCNPGFYKETLDPFFAIAIFVFGLAFGSFLNVCIYRLPLGLSVVRPRSACPGCNQPIASYYNIT